MMLSVLISEPDGRKAVLAGINDDLRLISPLQIAGELCCISESNGNASMTMDEIDAEIAAYRNEKRQSA
jgi:hypothetical protein